MQREGVELDRSTLAGWVGASSQLQRPLGEAVRSTERRREMSQARTKQPSRCSMVSVPPVPVDSSRVCHEVPTCFDRGHLMSVF